MTELIIEVLCKSAKTRQMEKHFYLVCGLPGSGKSYFARSFGDESEIINHDEILSSNNRIMGCRKARRETHRSIIERLSSLTSRIVIYDGVCSNKNGRLLFMSYVPSDYIKHIVYFTPPKLETDSEVEKYVKWLHEHRKTHVLFPSEYDRAVSTIKNIMSGFDPLSIEEIREYDCVVYDSYYTKN